MLEYKHRGDTIMINNNHENINYDVCIYNDARRFGAGTNIEDFSINELLYHPDPQVQDFNLIIITKYIKRDHDIIVKPLIAIYDKYSWEVNFKIEKGWYHYFHKTTCISRSNYICFNGNLKKIPCNNQQEIIDAYNIISEGLISHSKVKTKIKIMIKLLSNNN